MQSVLNNDQFILISILIQMGLIAAISTIFIRFDTFKRMLFSEELGSRRKFYLIGHFGGVFALGVLTRLILNYQGADLSFAAAFLVGLLAGPLSGVGVGMLVGLPPLLFGEFISPLITVLYGLGGGLIFVSEKSLAERMNFSPFSIIRAPHYIKELLKNKKPHPQLLIIISCIVFPLLVILIKKNVDENLFYGLYSSNPFIVICIILSTLATVGIPLKIWNNTRVELLLAKEEKELIQAKLDAIKSKLKPHFLFNTLNTIYSSIRSEPDRARNIVLRLSEILRKLLESKGEFTKLSEEISLLESYLAIEEARFGQGKLKFKKDIENAALSYHVPAMLLQPIVENSVKHGISKSISSGEITLIARKNGSNLEIILNDNGIGISQNKLASVKKSGFGLSSVEQRLKLLFENDFTFEINSKINSGTEVKIFIPLLSEIIES